jgi:hypothetical protein
MRPDRGRDPPKRRGALRGAPDLQHLFGKPVDVGGTKPRPRRRVAQAGVLKIARDLFDPRGGR